MIEIIYIDDSIVVCIKPKGVLSAKDASGKTNMTELLAQQVGVSEVFPIHRLDREVGGIMVFALNREAAAKLSSEVASCTEFQKEYTALISGDPQNESGIFEDLLFKDSSKNKTFVVKKERKGTKKAKLAYTVLRRFDGKTLVGVRLFTGRTHQIRVQFSSRGMPIVGDRKYGGLPCSNGIALCSTALAFTHPVSGEKLKFTRDFDVEAFI